MTYTTKTDAYLQRVDSKVRTTVPYTVTDIRNNVVAQEKVVAFTGTSLSIKDLEKIVGVVTGENNYFLEEKKALSYNSPKIYSVVKKLNSFKSTKETGEILAAAP